MLKEKKLYLLILVSSFIVFLMDIYFLIGVILSFVLMNLFSKFYRFESKKFSLTYLYYLLFINLLIFGSNFTKFNLIGPIFLYDFLLFIFFIIVFITKFRLNSLLDTKSIGSIGIVSLLYFVISCYNHYDIIEIVIRQFALFGYLLLSYFIVKLINSANKTHINFINYMSLLALILQIIFIIKCILQNKNIFDGYNYFSQLTIMGIITCSALFITYNDKKIKFLGYLLCLFISTTFGHTSAFLSIFIIGITYIFMHINRFNKIIFLISSLALMLLIFIIVPQFHDDNAMWRLYYWFFIINNIFIENFGIIGNGFGIPYASQETAYFLQVERGYSTHLGENMESYLSPMHNSFLTVFFHIGFLPGLLILLGHFSFIKYIFQKNIKFNENIMFLGLSLIGLSIWASLNVILELPHSSSYYWLIYFVFLKEISDYNNKKYENFN